MDAAHGVGRLVFHALTDQVCGCRGAALWQDRLPGDVAHVGNDIPRLRVPLQHAKRKGAVCCGLKRGADVIKQNGCVLGLLAKPGVAAALDVLLPVRFVGYVCRLRRTWCKSAGR